MNLTKSLALIFYNDVQIKLWTKSSNRMNFTIFFGLIRMTGDVGHMYWGAQFLFREKMLLKTGNDSDLGCKIITFSYELSMFSQMLLLFLQKIKSSYFFCSHFRIKNLEVIFIINNYDRDFLSIIFWVKYSVNLYELCLLYRPFITQFPAAEDAIKFQTHKQAIL